MIDSNGLEDRVEPKPLSLKFPTKEEWKAQNTFKPYAKDIYVAQVVGLEEVQMKKYMSEETEPGVKVKCKLLYTVEGNEVMFADGGVAETNFITIWLKTEMYHLGYNKKTGEASKTRQFFTALFNLPETADFEVDEASCLNRKFKLFVGLVTKDDGSLKNTFENFSSYSPKTTT